jgi:hypothetical protein
MANKMPSKPGGSLGKTFLIGALILFGLALLVGTLTILFP